VGMFAALVNVLLVAAAIVSGVPLYSKTTPYTTKRGDVVDVKAVYDCVNSTGPNPNPVRIHEQYGSITDGEGPYGDYETCYWLIEALSCPACYITLTYSLFDLENTHDYVQHYSDNAFIVPLGPRYTGKTLPPLIQSTSYMLGVKFATDLSNPGGPYEGFFANWAIVNFDDGDHMYVCDGANATSLISAMSGTVASQTSGIYGNNWYCTWKISAPNSNYPSTYMIQWKFLDFQVEQGFDQLKLFRDTSFISQIEGTFNSVNVPTMNNDARYRSSSGMSISFQTDFSGSGRGFQANFSIIETLPTYYCDANAATIDATVIHGRLSDRAAYYDGNWNCKWTIKAAAKQQVVLKFSEFNTRTYYDYVRVYDGITFTTLLGTFHGTAIPPNVISSVGNGLSVTFITSSSTPLYSYPGFTAEYKVYDL